MVLAASVPIGLGIYWAWVHRDWSVQSRTAGFGAATGGALLGAWLGFNVTADFLALVTTILGAALGANLALIIVDIAREWPVRDRFAAGIARATLTDRRATGFD